MSNYFRCDVCGRETYGCNVVNGMKFCAKCYQETFGKDNQQNEIQQIKQQLEEKDKEIERLKVFEKAYYYNQLQASQEDIQKFQNLVNQSAVNINYIAIQELEKVKEKIDCEMAIREYDISEQTADVCVSIAEQIDQQIKELKGNNDEPRQSN